MAGELSQMLSWILALSSNRRWAAVLLIDRIAVVNHGVYSTAIRVAREHCLGPIAHSWNRCWAAVLLIALVACGPRDSGPARELAVAAASNLTGVFDEIGREFTPATGTRVVFTYGSTAQLAEQIANGAPFDVFAAADTEHVDSLIGRGLLLAQTRAVYATGSVALWYPGGEGKEIGDIVKPEIRVIAIAKPSAAPYGRAAREALEKLDLWKRVEPRAVYANNIQMARQFGDSGNAEAVFTAYSLVLRERGVVIRIDEKLHAPLQQALAVVGASRRPEESKRFAAFVGSPAARAILSKYGYR